MEKKTYVAEKNRIEIEMECLRNEKKELREEYISENRIFQDDEKVKLIDENGKFLRFAFIRSAGIGYRNDVEYKLSKIKKDGGISKHEDWLWHNVHIEKCK